MMTSQFYLDVNSFQKPTLAGSLPIPIASHTKPEGVALKRSRCAEIFLDFQLRDAFAAVTAKALRLKRDC